MTIPFRRVVLALVFVACTAADGDKPPPAFLLATADGKPLTGPLRELTADWSLRLGDGPQLASGDWLSLRREGRKLPPLPSGPHLVFVNGDRVPFDSIRLDDDRLFFKHPDLADGKECRVPLTALSVVWFTPVDGGDAPDRLRRTLAKGSRTRDQVLLRNGDVLEGVLNGLSAKKVEVEVDKKPVEIAADKVAAVALGTDIVTALRPKTLYGRVVLLGDGPMNGTRLSLASATSDGRTLVGKTLFGSSLSVPLDRVAALDIYQGKAVYLSDLKPAHFEFTPYLGDDAPTWPLVADGSVANRDLRVGGATYDKGIGLHSRSHVTYNLAGNYRRFEALVGLDDETGKKGSVRIRVLADGTALDLALKGDLTAKHGPASINVSVVGVKELILEVDFGEGGDVDDHVNWCDARLVK